MCSPYLWNANYTLHKQTVRRPVIKSGRRARQQKCSKSISINHNKIDCQRENFSNASKDRLLCHMLANISAGIAVESQTNYFETPNFCTASKIYCGQTKLRSTCLKGTHNSVKERHPCCGNTAESRRLLSTEKIHSRVYHDFSRPNWRTSVCQLRPNKRHMWNTRTTA